MVGLYCNTFMEQTSIVGGKVQGVMHRPAVEGRLVIVQAGTCLKGSHDATKHYQERLVVKIRHYMLCRVYYGLDCYERIPNLTGEQSDGITVFRIPPMTSLMLRRCRTGAINLQRWWQSPSVNLIGSCIGRELADE
ncbi:hypothetical protein ANN_06510 [Periplaneta americana]|uniref:Per a allergen n=1 Tax=Periplaneta americana TaxID=6978 RepID=A0ABQ8TEL6_PERAM|nr:hypothetical protein ANN_06510 [Periplaneta americana]